MGDYTRAPEDRLAKGLAKNYVGVRIQQGVPVTDADLNELQDLSRSVTEDLGSSFIGDGVPVGSDGFRILQIGQETGARLVLSSVETDIDLSALTIELASSTGASALGFDTQNFETRPGAAPARLTSDRAEPYGLADGDTLTVQAENSPVETVTFAAADFGDITAATATELVTVLNNTLANAQASTETGNDFLIHGRDLTRDNSGKIIAGGQIAVNESHVKYTDQPLFENTDLAARWGVDSVPALTTPTADTAFTVYLDVWNREVEASEDSDIVDPNIGIETSARLIRCWAVRVATTIDYAALATRVPVGHVFYSLASITRPVGEPEIQHSMIVDSRETDLGMRREVAYRDSAGNVVVSTTDFLSTLIQCRDNFRDFLQYLTSELVDPSSEFLAGEVSGMAALTSVTNVAEQGIALLDMHALGTQGALSLFRQLRDAEAVLISRWRDVLFTVEKLSDGLIYKDRFESMIGKIEGYLDGPAPTGLVPVTEALDEGNLFRANQSQERINEEIGDELDRPIGTLLVTYLGATTADPLESNKAVVLQYGVSGSVTPADGITVDVTLHGWTFTLFDSNGTEVREEIDPVMVIGPGEGSGTFEISVVPDASVQPSTTLDIRVEAQNNSALGRNGIQKSLVIGESPPPSEADYPIRVHAIVSRPGDAYELAPDTATSFGFEVRNNTTDDLTADLSYDPTTSTDWQITKGSFGLTGQLIPAGGDELFHFEFEASTGAPDLTFRFMVAESGGAQVAEAQMKLRIV